MYFKYLTNSDMDVFYFRFYGFILGHFNPIRALREYVILIRKRLVGEIKIIKGGNHVYVGWLLLKMRVFDAYYQIFI
jgi:hypothetical protein